MAKDPAVLFYTSDFISGTLTMSHEQRGKYILLLCLQHQNGKLSEREMLKICGEKDEDIWCKFYQEDGYFYNKRMLLETEKRTKYSESRRNNRAKKEDNICKTYDTHMENENENENKDDIDNKKMVSIFEIFRQNYPGTRRGMLVELENLKKKHKDWKEIIPILSDALTYQNSCREIKRKAGGFVPEWKNLQTWINQRCWEEEIEINNISNGTNKKHNGATSEEIIRAVAKNFPVEGFPE